MTKPTEVVLITGAASGLGRATAKLLVARGYHVEGADKQAMTDLGFPIAAVDVRDNRAVSRWVGEVAERHGGIDAVVTFAGYGLMGAVEETSPAEAADLFDVNVIGTGRVIRAALPRLRGQGRGRVVVVSSGAAGAAQPFGGWYSASKAAVEKLGEALRMEAAPYGVAVSVLAPGWTRTAILDSARQVHGSVDAYAAARTGVRRRLGEYLAHGQHPDAVACTVARVLSARRPRQMYRVGADARSSFWARRLLPTGIYQRMVRDYYGVDHAAQSVSP